MKIADLIEFNTAVTAGKLFQCFVDLCLEGIQFCSSSGRRCEFCDAHFHSCFTNHQEANCTEYCMDQWIQNWNLLNAEKNAGNDIYKILLFVCFGFYACSLIALLTLCICKPRFRAWVISSVNCFQRNTTIRSSTCFLCGHPSSAVGPSNRHTISPPLTANPNTVAPFATPVSTLDGIASQPIAQNGRINTERQDGDGRSHFGRSCDDHREEESQNTVPHSQHRVQLPSPSTNPNERTPPNQYLTKSSRPNGTQTGTRTLANDKDKGAVPLLKSEPNGSIHLNNLDESVTYEKHRTNASINRLLGNEVSAVPSSNRYSSLPYFYDRSADTGYVTGATS